MKILDARFSSILVTTQKGEHTYVVEFYLDEIADTLELERKCDVDDDFQASVSSVFTEDEIQKLFEVAKEKARKITK